MQIIQDRYAKSLSFLFAFGMAACTPATDPVADAGTPAADAGPVPTPDAGAEDDAGTPADGGAAPEDGGSGRPDGGRPVVEYENEDCDNPEVVTPGQSIDASTAGAEDDHTGSCGGSGGADLVYKVTLDEPSGLVVEADGYDMVMYVTQDGCSGSEEVENGCVDDIGTTEYLAFDLLPAGDYNIIIDTYVLFDSAGDDFSLDVNVYPGGYCVGDLFDPANSMSGDATSLGAGDIDTQNLDPDADEPVTVDLVLCSEDTDYFVLGHMGGGLDVVLTPMMAAGTLTGELYEATESDTGLTSLTLGEKIQDLPVGPATDIDRGYYYLKITGQDIPGLGDSYSLKIEHACQPDEYDDASLRTDDSSYENSLLNFTSRPGAPIERSLCGNDVDTMTVDILYAVDLKVDLLGGNGLDYEVFEVIEEDNEEVLNAFAGEVNPTVTGDNLRLTFPGLPEDTRLMILTKLAPDAPFTPVEYQVDLMFGDPPENGDCSAAQNLSSASDSDAVLGSTLNGQSNLVGPCNGEESAAEDGEPGAADVFYTFTVPGDFDTDIIFDGTINPDASVLDFEGSVYLFQYPGSCPTDLSELIPVLTDPEDAESEPLCETGQDFRMRIPQMSAGEYLMVVDGVYDSFFGSVDRSAGRFQITVKSYPEGFPPPLACTEAVSEVLPGPGGSIAVEVDTSTGTNEFTYEDYGCFSFGARGKEKVITFTPDVDMTVDIETAGDVDTMIVLREGACLTTDEEADLGCDDDGAGDFGGPSRLSNQELSAGTPYFLFIDGYSGSDEGVVTVNISVQ